MRTGRLGVVRALPVRLVALAALALSVGLAACGEKEEAEPSTLTVAAEKTTTTGPGDEDGAGGGGQGGGPSPEDEVTEALETVIGGGSPDLVCGGLTTERYVNQAYGDAQGCRAAVSSQGSFAVAVEDVAIQDDAATATARPAGGPNKGEQIRSQLVLDGGAWKVDSLRSNAPAGP